VDLVEKTAALQHGQGLEAEAAETATLVKGLGRSIAFGDREGDLAQAIAAARLVAVAVLLSGALVGSVVATPEAGAQAPAGQTQPQPLVFGRAPTRARAS